jgi:hypothetical protein
MSNKTIRAALESRLATWAATQSLTVAYENVAFNQPATTYLRAWFLPANTDSLDVEGKHTLYLGIFQIDIVGVENVGTGTVGGIVDSISTLFPNNLLITKSGLTIRTVGPVSAKPGEYEPGRYIVKVSIPYRCDTI